MANTIPPFSIVGLKTPADDFDAKNNPYEVDKKQIISGLADEFKTVKDGIADLKTAGGAAADSATKKWFMDASTTIPALLLGAIPSSWAAWKSSSADSKLNKIGPATAQSIATAMKEAKPGLLLKASAVGAFVLSAVGVFVGMGQKAGHKAAQRIV
jgi:hypothetical protein